MDSENRARVLDPFQDMELVQPRRIAVLAGSPCLESACRAASAPVAGYLLKPLPAERLVAMFEDARPAGTDPTDGKPTGGSVPASGQDAADRRLPPSTSA